mgnify:FL=1
MPLITLTTMRGMIRTPVHVNTDHIVYWLESTAQNRPGTYLYFSAPHFHEFNPLFVEETFQETQALIPPEASWPSPKP